MRTKSHTLTQLMNQMLDFNIILGAQVPRVISQPSTTSITQNADPAVPLPHHSSSRPHHLEALSNQQMWTTLETLKRQDQFHPSQFHALMPFHRLIRESECSDISFRDFAQEIWGAMEYKPDAAYCVDSLIDEYMPSRPVSEFDLKGSVSVPFTTPSAQPLSTFAASMKREKTFYRRIPNSTKFLGHIP